MSMKKLIIFVVILLVFSCNKDELSRSDKFYSDQEIRNCKPASQNKRKVLFIGIDGVRTDGLLNANTPAMDSLIASGFFISGVDRGPCTVSVPGWSTLLHGVFPAKHGLLDNSFDQQDNFIQFPDMFSRIREVYPDYNLCSITNWYNFQRLTSEEDYSIAVDTDEELKDSAIWILDNCNPDLFLLHFDEVDAAGHDIGFDPQQPDYIAAIEQTDEYIAEIMQKIRQREWALNEKWMIVICTDHGGSGTSHGGQDNNPATRYVFLILNGEGIPNKNQIGNSANTDVFPTVMKYMNITIHEDWGLDGSALF